MPSKNDEAWNHVFAKTDILNNIARNGIFRISADTLNSVGQREARLMAKIDSSSALPLVFKEHKLNILPVTRGEYVVFEDPKNKCFAKVPNFSIEGQPEKHDPQGSFNIFGLETLELGVCSSENSVIDLAYLSNLLERFLNLKNLVLTRRGRLGSGKFILDLPSRNLRVEINNAQIEIDSVYECNEAVVLIEAKIGFRKDFHIRQLYYPYIWLTTQTTKKIIPVLLTYSNGQFEFVEYEFETEFGSVNTKTHARFVIDEDAMARVNLPLLLKFLPKPVEVPDTPFPQADDFEKVVDFVSAIGDGTTESEQLSDRYGFVQRQAGYYFNAAKYLGFVNSEKMLTIDGYRLLTQKFRVNRCERLLKSMLVRPVFRAAFDKLVSVDFSLEEVSVADIEKWIDEFRSDKLAAYTRQRRAQTVRSWLHWIIKNIHFDN